MVYAATALVVAYWIASIIRICFLCKPIAYLWDKNIADGVCMNVTAAYLSVSGINLILDIMVVALPMPILWTLQMPKSKKIAISAVFGVGIM